MIKQIFLSTIVTSFLGIQVNVNLPNSQQMVANVSAQLINLEQQLSNSLSSIEQLLMSGNANASQSGIRQGMKSVNQDLSQVQQLMDETITQTSHVHRLPNVTTGKSVQLANGITLSAGDRGVRSPELTLATNDISQVALPILTTNLGDTPKDASIVLFSTKRAYAKALQQGGVDEQEIPSIVSGTGGITVGSQVWIPLYALQDESDLANVLTHELTHAVLNQEGIGDSLPTWLNEGTAWLDGMTAERQVNPDAADLLTSAYNQDLQQAEQDGQLLPLTASEQDILNASYNVEWEDYLAVKNLIDTYGQSQFEAFLTDAHAGVEQSFKNAFGISMADYEQQTLQEITGMN
jgi:hypothetical protein